jgi:hypothetical protein
MTDAVEDHRIKQRPAREPSSQMQVESLVVAPEECTDFPIPLFFQQDDSAISSNPFDFQAQPAAKGPETGYTPPEVGDLRQSEPSTLGKLAQSARDKQLGYAKGCLIFVGIMTMLLNLFMLFNLTNEVNTELNKLTIQGVQNRTEVEAVMYAFGYLIYGSTVVVGILFIVLGCLVRKYPVPATIGGLVLFIGGNIVFALFDPLNLVRGIIIKIIILVVLIKAVSAALAYEKEKAVSWQPGQ